MSRQSPHGCARGVSRHKLLHGLGFPTDQWFFPPVSPEENYRIASASRMINGFQPVSVSPEASFAIAFRLINCQSLLLQWVMPKLLNRINHSQNILRWNIIHHRVHRANHATTTRSERFNHASHFLTHIRDTPMRQNSMGIDTTTKDNIVAIVFLIECRSDILPADV